jgi:hypothetical protein
MALRDTLFRSMRTGPGGVCLDIELPGSGILMASEHIFNGSAIFIDCWQGMDFFTIGIVDKSMTCLSNEMSDEAFLLNSGQQQRSYRAGSRSINDGQTPYLARVTISPTATTQSWWAFFLRYLAAQKAGSDSSVQQVHQIIHTPFGDITR